MAGPDRQKLGQEGKLGKDTQEICAPCVSRHYLAV
jgi:hypothetical protein